MVDEVWDSLEAFGKVLEICYIYKVINDRIKKGIVDI